MTRSIVSFFTAVLMTLALGGAVDESRAAVTMEDIEGVYDFVAFGPGEDSLDIELSTIAFNGQGSWGVPNLDAPENAGAYEIDALGRLMTVTLAGEEILTLTTSGAISPDATIIALPETEFPEEPGYTILVKRDTQITPGDLAGNRYNFVEFSVFVENGTPSPEVSAGYMEIDGDGTSLTVYEQVNSGEGEVDKTFGPMSFTVADGRLSALDGDATGLIGPAGDFIVIAKEIQGQEGVIFMSRSSNVGNGALYGWYNLTTWGLDISDGKTAVSSDALFVDGNGGWILLEGEEELAGTYDIGSQGRLVLKLTDPENQPITSFGGVSPDGHLFIVPEIDEWGIGITMGVKMPLRSVQLSSDTTDIQTYDSTAKTVQQLKEEYQNVYGDFQPFSEVVSFTATGAGNETHEFTFDTSGLAGPVSNLLLLKLKDSDNSLEFFYALEAETMPGSYLDGTWWLTDSGVYLDSSETLDVKKEYKIHFAIQDNGDYDLDDREGFIKDPTVLGASVESTDTETDSLGGSSSSSGCFISSLK